MAQITAQQAGGQNVVAFLDMLAWSEGTDNGRQTTRDRGYDVLVGGGLFSDYSRHPNVAVRLDRYKIVSTAAGRYQFIRKTWAACQKALTLPDFSPLSQDLACIHLIKGRRALAAVKAGRIYEAIHLCAKEWASLPGAGYGQHEQRSDKLVARYVQGGGEVAP